MGALGTGATGTGDIGDAGTTPGDVEDPGDTVGGTVGHAPGHREDVSTSSVGGREDAGSTTRLDEGDDADDAASAYGRRVGERLRAIRRQKRLSLQDVEASSNQEFKASVLGAYERGERAISVPRLERLAQYYSVPVDQLLPRSSAGTATGEVLDLTGRTGRDGVTIHLAQLDNVPRPEGEMLGRYLVMIQVQRQDFNGRVLTIRQDDLRAVACILGVEIDAAVDRLADLGLTHLADA